MRIYREIYRENGEIKQKQKRSEGWIETEQGETERSEQSEQERTR